MKPISSRISSLLALAGLSLSSMAGCMADVSQSDLEAAELDEQAELGSSSEALDGVTMLNPNLIKNIGGLVSKLRIPVATYPRYSVEQTQALLTPVLQHGRISTQNNELKDFVAFGEHPVMIGKFGNWPLFKNVYPTKAMVDFLVGLDATGSNVSAGLIYFKGGDPDNAHTRKGEWADPPDPNIYLNHGADFTACNGARTSPFDPYNTLNTVVCILDSLPAGNYDLGLPREAYPAGKSNSYGSSDKDITTYFKPEAANSPGLAYTILEIDENKWYIDESTYGPLRRWMPWYTNEAFDPNSPLLAADMAWMTPADRSALSTAMARGDYPNMVRYLLRDRSFGHAVADAMQRAMARGVKFGGIYGDALDHFHVQVR